MSARSRSGVANSIRTPAPHTDVYPDRERISALAAMIAERFQPRQIVLFGSHAYGRVTTDSDVDLLVIMDTPGRSVDLAIRIRQAIGLRPSFPLDILVRTPEQIRVGLAERDFFIVDAVERGVTLFTDGSSEKGADWLENAGGAERAESALKHATLGWVKKAEMDYRSALRLGEPPNPIAESVCFHAQQTVEKYLTSCLQQHEIDFPRTHDLSELELLASSRLPNVTAGRSDLMWLTDCAVAIRYPDAAGDETGVARVDAHRALRIATRMRLLFRAALDLPLTA